MPDARWRVGISPLWDRPGRLGSSGSPTKSPGGGTRRGSLGKCGPQCVCRRSIRFRGRKPVAHGRDDGMRRPSISRRIMTSHCSARSARSPACASSVSRRRIWASISARARPRRSSASATARVMRSSASVLLPLMRASACDAIHFRDKIGKTAACQTSVPRRNRPPHRCLRAPALLEATRAEPVAADFVEMGQ